MAGKGRYQILAPTTGEVLTKTCTLADTEYSQALPEGTKIFDIKIRGHSDLKWCFTSGASGTTYSEIEAGSSFQSPPIYAVEMTLYFQSPDAGAVVEIIAWQ